MNCISLSISCAIDLIRLVLLKYILSKSIRLYTSYYLIFESHFDILVTSIFVLDPTTNGVPLFLIGNKK